MEEHLTVEMREKLAEAQAEAAPLAALDTEA